MLTKKKDAKLYAASQTLWIYDICWELGWGGDTNEFLEAFVSYFRVIRIVCDVFKKSHIQFGQWSPQSATLPPCMENVHTLTGF